MLALLRHDARAHQGGGRDGGEPKPRVAANPPVMKVQPRGPDVDKDGGFVNVGERCNIAGLKFKKLILDGQYDKGSRSRGAGGEGAQVIDVNMDEGLSTASLR